MGPTQHMLIACGASTCIGTRRAHAHTHAPARARCHRFVVSFFLADNTLSVYEPPRRNSGIPGGVFAERTRARRPGGGALDCHQPADMAVRPAHAACAFACGAAQPHSAQGKRACIHARAHVRKAPAIVQTWPSTRSSKLRQIGARVTVSARVFELTDADEATLKLMERQPAAFPCADAAQVRLGWGQCRGPSTARWLSEACCCCTVGRAPGSTARHTTSKRAPAGAAAPGTGARRTAARGGGAAAAASGLRFGHRRWRRRGAGVGQRAGAA